MDYPVKTAGQLRPLLMGFRKAAGLTQAQMATRLGVTQQTYAQLEARPESASMERLLKALRLLKVQIVLAQPTGSIRPGSNVNRPIQAPSPLLAKRVQPGARKNPVKLTAGDVLPPAAAASSKPARSGSPKGKEPSRAGSAAVGSHSRKREDW